MRRLLIIAACALLPAAAAAQNPPDPAATGTKVDASRGGITISSGANSLTIGARAQFRWTLDDREDLDGDTAGTGVGRADGPLSQFDVPRMRVSLSGGVYRPWLRYEFQFDFSRTNGEGASKIKDAVIEIRPPGRSVRFRGGQFKVPFGLQELTSSGRQQFVDRAITAAKFTPSRDMGIAVMGTVGGRRAGYEAGVFNGAGENARQNTASHLWAGRVYVQPLGAYALSEGASDAGDRPVLHLGAGIVSGKQIRGRSAAGVIENPDNQTGTNIELAFKAARVFATVEHFWMTDEFDNPVSSRDISARGFHAQASYMIIPRQLEAGLRFAQVTPDTDVNDADLSEARVVTGYYWQGHSLKLQADAGQVVYGERFASLPARARQGLPSLGPRLTSGRDFTDRQLRVQIQIAF